MAKRRCLLISPIGDEGSGVREHADDVFRLIIEPAVKKFNIEAVRSDHIHEAGEITEQMFRGVCRKRKFEVDLLSDAGRRDHGSEACGSSQADIGSYRGQCAPLSDLQDRICVDPA